MDRNAEGRAWDNLLRPVQRGAYEHLATWRKRTNRHARFVGKIRREASGCWVWTGLSVTVHGHPYPKVAVRDLLTQASTQQAAFQHMVGEYLPEFARLARGRTKPTCGNYLCISPVHRTSYVVTRHKITADQAREVYAAKDLVDASEIAQSVGVSRYQVLSIWRGESWAAETGATPHVARKVVSDEVVLAIQARKGQASARKVAAEFGIGASTVSRIWQGWRQPSNRADLPAEQDA